MSKQKRIVIIGATSAIAEQCARLWNKGTNLELILVARDVSKAERIAADLLVRNPFSTVSVIQANLLDVSAIRPMVDSILRKGAVDLVLIAQGLLPDQQECQNDVTLCQEVIAINGLSPVLLAEAFVGAMEQANAGTLAIIGSVAGDRGRKSNYVYGAAKGLVERYAEGLQHRLAKTAVRVVLIKPGPTDTPMTAHLKEQGTPLASAADVARQIVKGVEQGKRVVYTPTKWALIMLIIRHLPSRVFHRLNI